MRAVPSKPVFCTTSTLRFIPNFSRCVFKFPVAVPKAPLTMGRMTTFSTSCFQHLRISYFRSVKSSIFSFSSFMTLVSNGHATSRTKQTFLLLSSKTTSGLLCSIFLSVCIEKSHRILASSFSKILVSFSTKCS